MSDKTLVTTLELTRIDDLFTKPDTTPLSPDYRTHSYTSGVEFIAGELYADQTLKHVELTLILPSNIAQETDPEAIRAAIRRYSDAKLADLEQDRRAMVGRGVRALAVAVVALIFFIGLSRLIKQDGNVAREIIGEGLSIAGWVALWFPLELLSFNVWQLSLDKKIYKRLADSEIKLQAAL